MPSLWGSGRCSRPSGRVRRGRSSWPGSHGPHPDFGSFCGRQDSRRYPCRRCRDRRWSDLAGSSTTRAWPPACDASDQSSGNPICEGWSCPATRWCSFSTGSPDRRGGGSRRSGGAATARGSRYPGGAGGLGGIPPPSPGGPRGQPGQGHRPSEGVRVLGGRAGWPSAAHHPRFVAANRPPRSGPRFGGNRALPPRRRTVRRGSVHPHARYGELAQRFGGCWRGPVRVRAEGSRRAMNPHGRSRLSLSSTYVPFCYARNPCVYSAERGILLSDLRLLRILRIEDPFVRGSGQ